MIVRKSSSLLHTWLLRIIIKHLLAGHWVYTLSLVSKELWWRLDLTTLIHKWSLVFSSVWLKLWNLNLLLQSSLFFKNSSILNFSWFHINHHVFKFKISNWRIDFLRLNLLDAHFLILLLENLILIFKNLLSNVNRDVSRIRWYSGIAIS